MFTISGVNQLPDPEKRKIYARLIPEGLCKRFNLPSSLIDPQGNDLLGISGSAGTTSAEMSLYHEHGFPDPILYGHITDTINGQIHVLLYILNDPNSPRFDVDKMPDGSPTNFGTQRRNIPAETAAMQAGLAPGQVRRGLRLLGEAIAAFERFVSSLGHSMYFAEPLYYHNAVIFESYGFGYAKGRKLMETIQSGFASGGELHRHLDDSSPFRSAQAANSIRLRSWALHDGLLGEPFSGVTMYKPVGKNMSMVTCTDCDW